MMIASTLCFFALFSSARALKINEPENSLGSPDLQRSRGGLNLREKYGAQYEQDRAWLFRHFSSSGHPYDMTLSPADSYVKYTTKLNNVLLQEKGLRTQPCKDFSINSLLDLQKTLLKARAPYLDDVHKERGSALSLENVLGTDNMMYIEERREQYAAWDLTPGSDWMLMERDNACHHVNTLFAHHLSVPTREELKSQIVLPLLPTEMAPDTEAILANMFAQNGYPLALSQMSSKGQGKVKCRPAKVPYAYMCIGKKWYCPYNQCCDWDGDGKIDVDNATPPPWVVKQFPWTAKNRTG